MASNNLELIIKLAKDEAEAAAKEFADNTTKSLNSIESNVKLNTFIMVLKDSFRAAKKIAQELAEAVGSLAEASEAFNIPVTRLGGAWNEVKKNIGDALAQSPEFKEFTQLVGRAFNQMSTWAASAEGGKAIVGVFKDLTKAMLTTLSVGTNFLEFLAATKDSWKNMAAPLEVSKNALTGMLELTVPKASNSAEAIRKFRVEVDKLRDALDKQDGLKMFGPELPSFDYFGAQTEQQKKASEARKKSEKEYADWLKKFKQEKADEEADNLAKQYAFTDKAHADSAKRKLAIEKNYADTIDGIRDWTRDQEKQARAGELKAREDQAAEDIAREKRGYEERAALVSSIAAPALNSAFAQMGQGAKTFGEIMQGMVGSIIQTMGTMLIEMGVVAVMGGTVSTAVPALAALFGGPAGVVAGGAAIAAGGAMVALGASMGGDGQSGIPGPPSAAPTFGSKRGSPTMGGGHSSSNGLASSDMGFGGSGQDSGPKTSIYNITFGSGVITGTPAQVARSIKIALKSSAENLGG